MREQQLSDLILISNHGKIYYVRRTSPKAEPVTLVAREAWNVGMPNVRMAVKRVKRSKVVDSEVTAAAEASTIAPWPSTCAAIAGCPVADMVVRWAHGCWFRGGNKFVVSVM